MLVTKVGRAALCAAWGLAAAAPAGASDRPVARADVSAALARLGAMAEDLVAAGGAPGLSIVVVHEGETVYLEGFGVRREGAPEAVDGDTVFQLASMSKPVSATLVAALVSDETLTWDSRIVDLAPEYRMHDPYPSAEVTLRDLFNHRSGLPGGTGNELESIGFDRDVILERLRLAPPASSFRGGYSYSNFGLTMGGLAAARASGKDWETLAEERLFAPLGMSDTSYRHSDFAARANSASLHARIDGRWSPAVTRNADAQAPAGGISSSARDLAAWLRLELARGMKDGAPFIAEDALAATHEPLTSRGPGPVTGAPEFYGLGWNVEYGRHGVTWGHAGAFSVGARTLVTLWPDSDLGMVVLANAFPTGVPEGLADSFADLVFNGAVAQDYVAAWNAAYEGLYGPAMAAAEARFDAPPDPATPPLPLSAYAGDYANDFVGGAVVTEEDGKLTLAVGPEGATRYPLTHFDRDLFLYYATPEMPDLPDTLLFEIGPDGRASRFTASSLDGEGLGTLARAAP